VKGGISLTQGEATTSDSMITYANGAVYTFKITTGNYIPSGGSMIIKMPTGISIEEDPFSKFQASESNLVPSSVYDSSSVTIKALAKIPAGDYVISIGGIRNSRSFEPSEVFEAISFDASGNVVGDGSIDNIQMTEAGKFTVMTITPSNQTNGAINDYLVKYTTSIPDADGDLFYLSFPKTIRTPKEPVCEKGDCV